MSNWRKVRSAEGGLERLAEADLATIPELLATPDAPALGARLYVLDTAGTKKLRVIFANGNTKVIADDT